ncbi:MAG: hypothetical protein ACRDQH_02585 [Pseudonocardiaceae bacterium]
MLRLQLDENAVRPGFPVRAAILAAERSHRRARLRSEAEELLNDPDDVAASRELAAEMDVIRAW